MKVLIVYYSLYGHTLQLAQAVKEGIESVKGTEALFRRVEEFEIVVKKTGKDAYLSQVREQQKDIPDLRLAHPLRQHDRADETAHRLNWWPVAQG